jgi:serine/threonine-protein kinase
VLGFRAVSTTGVGETTDSRQLLQERVASFGLAVAIILLLSLVARLLLGLGFGYIGREIVHPSFWAHAVSWIPVFVVWLICRGKPLDTPVIQVVETIGLVLTSVCLVVMGANLPAAAGAATTTAYSLSFVLIARVVFVPSTAKHTAWLGFLVGVPLVIAVYLNFLQVDLDVWNSHGFFREITDERVLARSQAIQIGFAWGLTTLLAAWATRVIYGLRRDVRDAKKLGQYVVEEKLGEGGMGAVYRAHHAMLKRPTAVKLLGADRNAPEDLDRFRREVQMTAKLKHPNTVTIFDYGRTDDGTFYYAMELLDGVTLHEIVSAEGMLPEARVAHILYQCSMALQEAHAMGLVHRDIKPNNIMMTEQGGVYDVTKVLDFGLVKSIDSQADATETVSESIIGTPRFMSPEQILDPPSIDARSDLYALGAVGYYLLTGKFVFEGNNPIEICAQHLSAEPELPSLRVDCDVDVELELLIMQCLEKKREARPASALEIANRIEAMDIPRWTQLDAAAWWDAVGREMVDARDSRHLVGSLPTIARGFGTDE